MRFSRMKHAISEKLYFVYYLRNGVLSSEISPKIQGFTCDSALSPHATKLMLPIFVKDAEDSRITLINNIDD